MLEESSSPDPAVSTRRRVVRVPERAVLPVAVIAHPGEQRDQLETQIELARPVVCFPSLSHFTSDASRERWAGILIARMHAWDARLDQYVPRRAFIAMFRLAEEDYGWPDTVRRLATPEELDAWLAELASPVLPPEDKPVVIKPKRPRATVTRRPTSQQTLFQLAPANAVVFVGNAANGRPTLPPAQAATATDSNATQAAGSGDRPSSKPRTTPPARQTAHASETRARSGRLPAAARRAQGGGRGAKPEGVVPLPAGAQSKRAKTAEANAHDEQRLCELALEIGLVRAAELVALVRMRAHGSKLGRG